MNVVGGCYQEVVAEPSGRQLCGSGMRAAAILVSLGESPTLYTCIDEPTRSEMAGVAASYGVEVRAVDRPDPIEFRYATPLAIPSMSTAPHGGSVLELECETAVAFGMVEGSWAIRAERLVVDPQHATLESCGLADSSVGHLAVILNAREAQRLSGVRDFDAGAESLLDRCGAEVIVVKRGIRGASVVTRTGVTHVGAHPTEFVHPVGSGDAFTAGFVAAWMGSGAAGVDAARYASSVAAEYCLTGVAQIDGRRLASLPTPVPDSEARIYLAGPFFSAGERWLVEQALGGLSGLGVNVFSPLHEIGLGGDEVAQQDLDGLEHCDGVLALLDGADPGTLFEIGWARHLGLPVVAFSAAPTSRQWTMLRGTGCEIGDDLPTAVYRAGWAAIGHAAGSNP